jgi:murein DD-endopeptidase MepM/ murein hydrolase activator NlpD
MVLKGFGQTAPFYYSRSEGDWVALLAVPLTADQGTAPLEIDWSKGSHALSVVVGPDPYPATRSLKVRGLRRRLARAETSGDSVLLRRREEGDAPEPLWTGRFRWPLDGTITVTSPFGARREYNNGQAAWRHQGVDLRAAAGSPVRSANSGRVVLVRRSMALTGGTVVVDHGYGLVSCYFHLSTIGVRRGQYVRKGEALGMSGSSGLSNGPHLHFEMRLHGVAVSPLQWVGNPDERAANLSAPRAKAS